jgi:hypothetical protein
MITRREANIGLLASAAIAAASGLVSAQELPPLDLPRPRSEGGMPLTEALRLETFDPGIFDPVYADASSVRSLVGRLRHQSTGER